LHSDKERNLESSKNRIIGFDLARAYAIFGMFIVTFNTVFGSHTNHEGLSGFLIFSMETQAPYS
jgi:hypothetical protein